MNELAIATKDLQTSADISKTVLGVCTAITPQFYKNKSDAELRAETASIKLLTQGMEAEVVAEMCNLAAENYARERSHNARTYFDINYIVTFYSKAFNRVHDKVPAGYCVLLDEMYDESTGIVTRRLGNIDSWDPETGFWEAGDVMECKRMEG